MLAMFRALWLAVLVGLFGIRPLTAPEAAPGRSVQLPAAEATPGHPAPLTPAEHAAAQPMPPDPPGWLELSPTHRAMLTRLRVSVEAGVRPDDLAAPCWSEETDPAVMEAFHAVLDPAPPPASFQDSWRWSATATDGPGLAQGDPTTLTWSIVPDGTTVNGLFGEPVSPSALVAFLDGVYGSGPGGSDLTQRPWFAILQGEVDRWETFTGVRYVYEPADDGASVPSLPGALGVRGDVRIGGHPIDGDYGLLAYNYYPDGGDMVLDTSDGALEKMANESRRLRNTIAHELGHGLGLRHVCPRDQTKLMESIIAHLFDGAQFDDVLTVNRGYGDPAEYPSGNDQVATATDLGFIAAGDTAAVDAGIDDATDTDVFAFTIPDGMQVTISLAPQGDPYEVGPEAGDGSCPPGVLFDPRDRSDLAVELLDSAGTGAIARADNQPAGLPETISRQALPDGAGTYFVRITGDSAQVQLYRLEVGAEIAAAHVAVPGVEPAPALAVRAIPNPHRNSASLRFELPTASPLRVEIFDSSGRRVRLLADGPARAGLHELTWDGRRDDGAAAGAGVYFARLTTPASSRMIRIVRIR
jgi:serralysin